MASCYDSLTAMPDDAPLQVLIAREENLCFDIRPNKNDMDILGKLLAPKYLVQ